MRDCCGSRSDPRNAATRAVRFRDSFSELDLAVEFAPGETCRVVATDPVVWPVPAEFAGRAPYRSCGASFALSNEDLEVPSDEQCLREAAGAGETAELTM